MCLEVVLKCMFEVLVPESVTKDAEPHIGEDVRVLHAALIW
jgi:hypothetical protein